MEMTGEEVSQTLSFRDGSTQWAASMKEGYDKTRDVTYHEDVPLSEFFARPVKVATYTWGTADVTPFFQTVDPWSLFLNNIRVSNRISNFQNFSGNLHVKFVINGNSFFYGRLMADYFPLRAYDSISNTAGGSAANIINVMQASQRLHIYIDPSESQAGELTLPFLWPYDKVNLVTGEFSSLGTLYLRQLQPLKHANGAVASVNITMFVWATDVKLSIPTVNDIQGIAPQAGTYDEYGQGPVSSMATALASAAGQLASIPYIGRYARATQMLSGTMGKVASMFGFSRPAIISDVSDMKPTIVSRIANYNGGDNVARLTMDAKQELTIDPSVMGLSGVDELSLSYLTTKESYLTQFPWTVAKVPNDPLFSVRVTPPWDTLTSSFYYPAITYASIPFTYWRGSLIYRFQVVASGYHKGRLLIVWDPIAQTGGPETNIQYSKIVDLADERDFTFEVGWGSNAAWLTMPTFSSTTLPFKNGSVYNTSSSNNCNGVVSVYVLNELTTPNSTVNNDIAINVFVSGCRDYKLSVPDDTYIKNIADQNALTPQSGTFEEVATEEKNAPRNETAKETIAMCEPLTDETDLVYMGETVVSFRQLIKRYCFWGSLYGVTSASANVQRLWMPDFPPNRGYSAYGAVLNTANNYNPSYTGIINYLSYAYTGFRGGIRKKVIINSSSTEGSLTAQVCRFPANSFPAIYATSSNDVITTQKAFAVQRANNQWFPTIQGGHVTVTKQQPSLEFEAPFYRNTRFGTCRNLGRRGTFAADQSSTLINVANPANAAVWYDIYVAGAEDATFMCFQGAPPLIYTNLV